MLDLRITQKDAALRLGVVATTVASWLKRRRAPNLRHFPAVIRFLEYDPRPPAAENLGEAILRWRKGKGQSQEELAKMLHVDPVTVALWERGRRLPTAGVLVRLNGLIQEVDS